MADDGLLYTAIALTFGAVAGSIPAFASSLNLQLVSVTLLQVGSLAVSGFAISRILGERGLSKILAGGIIIISGIVLSSTIGGEVLYDTQTQDYLVDENFEQNSTLLINLEESSNGEYLQFDSTYTGTAPTTGQYEHERFYGVENVTDIEFDQIAVQVDNWDSTVHNATLEVQTYEEGGVLGDKYEYNLTGGENRLNVSKINTARDVTSFDFYYEVTTNETDQTDPKIDFFKFDTTQTYETTTGNYGIVSILAGIIFIFGGIGVLFS